MHDITIILILVAICIALYWAIKFLRWLLKFEGKLIIRLLPIIIILVILFVVYAAVRDIFGLFIH